MKDLEQQGIVADGLRLLGLSKKYKTGWLGREGPNDIKALKNVYLEVADGELLAILGHNGAGKTTLINILTGILSPSSGEARICGRDLSTSIDEIRKFMGVVPQFDILWDDLTAIDHMWMFCQIKGVKNPESVTKQKLQEVDLWEQADAPVGTYSGGMRRRLSVAISGIGNPKIIFMDEPTTGMDPISRAKVWELMQELKKDKVVILTTHSMQEADVLSDRIAVISEGRFRCIGTSLFLKNTYGDGYK